MSKVLVTESYLEDIAEAIRTKTGGTDTYTPGEMAAGVLAIPSGGGSSLPDWLSVGEATVTYTNNYLYESSAEEGST